MKKSVAPVFGLALLGLFACEPKKQPAPPVTLVEAPAQFVNPFVGTAAHGHTYPGATRPFGMVQLSPDTRLEGWDGCSGYHYTDTEVYGFSHTHLSGTGVGDYNDVLLMPVIGYMGFDNGYKTSPDSGYASRFDKFTEQATAGYYAVALKDYGIDVELTSTERAGFHRYTFPESKEASIIIDLMHRDRLLDGKLEQVSPTEIQGFRISKAWAQKQHVYFVARFSKTPKKLDVQEVDFLNEEDQPDKQPLKAALRFDTEEGEQITVQVGISAVSIDGARANLDAELAGKTFDQVREESTMAWNEALGKIRVGGSDTAQLRTFYTALYHTLLAPNLFSDVDGSYRAMDGSVKKTNNGDRQYTVFSLWDTFRATHPLFTITEQERTNEFIRTFIRQFDDGGVLPIWELAGNYTGCMIGYHAIPVVADAYRKGIRDYDAEHIFEAMDYSAKLEHLGLDHYKELGFIPSNLESESVSKTLEYAYDDWCIAQVAKEMGKDDMYREYMKRSQYYKNVFDPQSGFMRAKQNNRWWAPFDPYEVNFNYTEANSWQYSFFVPHDVAGLAGLVGGRDSLEQRLDNLFTASAETSGRHQSDITGLVGQYAHGNEPSHHMAYLYNFTGSPWKTQDRVSQIMRELYTDQPDGLCGNEDCGQMSAWYVLSAMGFYPVCPGNNEYVLGTPLFPKAEITLENGKTFVINAVQDGSTKGHYVHSVSLNGKSQKSSYITHEDIMAGGSLDFELSNESNKSWATAEADYPNSAIADDPLVTVPYFDFEGLTFVDSMQLSMASIQPGVEIRYTVDGSEPGASSPLYETPLTLSADATVRAVAVDASGNASAAVETSFLKVQGGRSITLMSEYDPQYSAGGDNGLIDHLTGDDEYRQGVWQGYQGQDLVAVVELDEARSVQEVSTGFLQDTRPWIIFPKQVEYAVSMDGEDYEVIATVPCDVPANDYTKQTKQFVGKIGGRKVRFIRVHAQTFGTLPEWHLGVGGKAWIFADEISIR